jgi:O-methyltransferase involved in polyketide biosynthesis/ribosomal protein S18 acetylase RimI-like enzyme
MSFKAFEKTSSDALLAKWSAWHIGYRPVTAHSDLYFDLLQQVARHVTASLKRQSPLVNAGYAARMASIAGTVQQFLSYHNNHDHPIDIVVLGCGLDVLGLWMYSLVKHKENARIIEVDTPQVCQTKLKVLSELGRIDEVKLDGTKGDTFRGSIRLPGSNSKEEQFEASGNYTLLAGDLRDIEWLEEALSFRNNTKIRPTLVIFELVLTYLGDSKIDQLLTLCSTKLCNASGSALVALEPLGPDKQQTKWLSVGNVYRDEYCRQFQAKLARGNIRIHENQSGANGDIEESSFSTLGHSCSSVENRLVEAGFQRAYVCSLGLSAACAQKQFGAMLQAPEPFDEHAALLLHVTSYVLVCAFTDHSSMDMQRLMCGWSDTLNTLIYVSPNKVDGRDEQSNSYIIAEIESASEDEQVRAMFKETYQSLFDGYPSVRRLVKGALKSDLAAHRGVTVRSCKSLIGVRYRHLGGIFIVAVKVDEAEFDANERHVIGFVGVRVSGRSLDVKSFEIQRFAVDETFRGKGIGVALLKTVEKALTAVCRRPCQLLATTPSILLSANDLYTSNGFVIQESKKVSNLTMNTYYKLLNDTIS